MNLIKLEKTLTKIAFFASIAALISAIFVLPNILRPFILGKMFPFQISVLILLVIWAVLMLLDFRKYRPRFNLLTIAVSIFYLVILLSCIFSLLPFRSFWGNAERMEGFISLFHFYLFFLAVSSIFFTDKEVIRKLVFTSICIAFLGAIFPIMELLKIVNMPVGENLSRPGGFFGNPTFFAGFLITHLFLLVWYYLNFGRDKRFKQQKYWMIIMGVVMLIVFFWTQTRGSIIGLMMGLFAALIASIFVIPDKKYKKIGIGAAGAIVILAALFFVFQSKIQESAISQKVPFIGRLTNISLSDASTRARILNWQRSFKWWQQRPILGYGQDMFYQVFDRNYSGDDFVLSHERFDRAHNKFFDVLVMNGIIGFFSYLFLLGVVAYLIFLKIKRSEKIIEKFSWLSIWALFIAYLVHNFFVFDTPANSIFFYFFLAFLNIFTKEIFEKKATTLQSPTASNPVSVKKFDALKIGATILILIVASFTFYHINYKPYQAAKLLFKANQINPTNINGVFSVYQKSVDLNTFINTEIKKPWADYFHNYLIYVHQGKIKGEKDQVAVAYEQIKKNLISGYEHEPMVDFYVYLANIAMRMSKLNLFSAEEKTIYAVEAGKYFNFLADNWPKRTDLYLNYALAQEYEISNQWLERILTNTPKFGPAIWLKAISLIKEKADANEIYVEISRAFDNGYQFSLANTGDYIFAVTNELSDLPQKKELLTFIDEGVIKEENVLKNRKLNAFERSIHFEKLKSLIDLVIFIEITTPPKDNEHIQRVINYLEKADFYQKNRIDILVKLAAAYAQLRDKEKAIEYARKVGMLDKRYATDVEIFIKLVEEEKWNQLF